MELRVAVVGAHHWVGGVARPRGLGPLAVRAEEFDRAVEALELPASGGGVVEELPVLVAGSVGLVEAQPGARGEALHLAVGAVARDEPHVPDAFGRVVDHDSRGMVVRPRIAEAVLPRKSPRGAGQAGGARTTRGVVQQSSRASPLRRTREPAVEARRAAGIATGRLAVGTARARCAGGAAARLIAGVRWWHRTAYLPRRCGARQNDVIQGRPLLAACGRARERILGVGARQAGHCLTRVAAYLDVGVNKIRHDCVRETGHAAKADRSTAARIACWIAVGRRRPTVPVDIGSDSADVLVLGVARKLPTHVRFDRAHASRGVASRIGRHAIRDLMGHRWYAIEAGAGAKTTGRARA